MVEANPVPLLAEPPRHLAGLVRTEELVDPARAETGRGRDLADGQPRLMGFDNGPDPLPPGPFKAFRREVEAGGEPHFATEPLFRLVVDFHPSRLRTGPLAVQQTERLDVIFCYVATTTPSKDDATEAKDRPRREGRHPSRGGRDCHLSDRSLGPVAGRPDGDAPRAGRMRAWGTVSWSATAFLAHEACDF